MDTITSYLPALQSVLPKFSSPSVSAFPEINDLAPAPLGNIDLSTGNNAPTLVAFVRHCGCPFAEKEVRLLAEETKRDKDVHVVIVQHSNEKVTREWFRDVGGDKLFPDPSRYTLLSDPDRTIYASWGIGELGWTSMVNGDIMKALHSQKLKDGIDLRPTGQGSYRWQNSGGFAVGRDGRIKWRKLAKDSSDICDYKEAARTIV